ncbi:hypothetical protein [Lysinibacillus capsici]|uniref:hypothetical protein n=1 Tax=Lysinibacillus capsici TaxID=2115968 RepID=UPI0028AC4883|nr:hypothetical protein [Lysinibacillus capsici]
MPKYEYKGRVINATERAYELLYKGRGFKIYEEQEPVDFSTLDANELDEYKVADLKKYLDDKNIKYKSSDNKDDLITLILVGEGDPDGTNGTEDPAATAGE